jgi:hypothetical protein
VEWHLLIRILEYHGFPSEFIDLIVECISTSSSSILIDRSPFGHFKSSRGLRQGDPMSPFLFVIYFDLLSRLISKAELEKRVHGIKVNRNSPAFSHLMYADGLVFFCGANLFEASEVLDILNLYTTWSNQSVNQEKSIIHFSRNVNVDLK